MEYTSRCRNDFNVQGYVGGAHVVALVGSSPHATLFAATAATVR
jgi:hypothetical protein